MNDLFSRMKQTLTADFYNVLDKMEQKNPISLLNQYLRQAEAETEKVRKLVERQYQLKAEFTKELAEAEGLAEKRKNQAKIAEKAGESELQAFAIQESELYSTRALRINEALLKSEKQLNELEYKYREMKHKLKDMNIRRMELMGKENLAHAHQRMNQVIDAGSTSSSSTGKFEDTENYLDNLEQRINSNYQRQSIDARIIQLEKDMKAEETHSIS
ncbi:PspA/IM30 family protein [Peribacillus psychrosaccharolyticus]|uniref:PspA/IM30 family protein n=1 Tax=Peribacillus psychrosaccharolyticus TaxID=1407 RepID=A0A974RYY7_PERPY|nr:PspA/IM30 family protein [Peribacillus psychrosaccharolyticus]MEC2055274.1 PspA/IM30 family protein [Peribacillus psychrosaccharolyticus]MED3745264.1 PspA/IM30 family protein [Peribacillus psychrosaccharolyticus]QQS98976.1 PspA/IM30 family protein [Peribacillus psychrosaccharolyticus]